jgi:hypothetical protein
VLKGGCVFGPLAGQSFDPIISSKVNGFDLETNHLVWPAPTFSTMLSSASVIIQRSLSIPLRSLTGADWPDPELSIGRGCCSLGRNKCWEVVGPAQETWNCIFPEVKRLLESRKEHVYERERTDIAVIIGFYMIGRNEKKSNPTLLLTCEKKAPRRNALQIIMESRMLSPYPGVLLAESARSPLALEPVMPLALDQAVLTNPGRIFNIYMATSASISKVPCGMLIHVRDSLDESAVGRNATIGGLVYSENEKFERTYYGITVAHVFIPRISNGGNDLGLIVDDGGEDEDGDIEFAFYGQGNDEEEDEAFVEATSRGELIQKRKGKEKKENVETLILPQVAFHRWGQSRECAKILLDLREPLAHRGILHKV